jgi:hypothetical protein
VSVQYETPSTRKVPTILYRNGTFPGQPKPSLNEGLRERSRQPLGLRIGSALASGFCSVFYC